MGTKKKGFYPCVECTGEEFCEQILPKLWEWGYDFTYLDRRLEKSNVIVTNFDDVSGCVANVFHENLKEYNRYLCNSINEFLEATKAIAINSGWYEE